MEPLRDAAFNMGQDGYWSWLWSLMFVAVGTLLIAVNHIVRYVLAHKKEEEASFSIKSNLIAASALAPISLGLIITGSILMSSNESGLSIALNGFNIGVICLVTGIAFLFLLAVACTELIIKLTHKNVEGLNA